MACAASSAHRLGARYRPPSCRPSRRATSSDAGIEQLALVLRHRRDHARHRHAQTRPKMARVSGRPGSASSTIAPCSSSIARRAVQRRRAIGIERRRRSRCGAPRPRAGPPRRPRSRAPVARIVRQAVGVAQVVPRHGAENISAASRTVRVIGPATATWRRRRAAIAGCARSSASRRPARNRPRGCGSTRPHRCRYAAARSRPRPPRRRRRTTRPACAAGSTGCG